MSGLINILLDVATIVSLISIVLLILSFIGWLLVIVISNIKDTIEDWREESEDEE